MHNSKIAIRSGRKIIWCYCINLAFSLKGNNLLKPITLAVITLLLTSISIAQIGVKYNQHFELGGNGSDYVHDMDHDPFGNLLIIGRFDSDSIDLDPDTGSFYLTHQGRQDIFVAKYQNGNELLWAFGIQSNARDQPLDIESDFQGNIIITGLTEGIVDLDPGLAIVNVGTQRQTRSFMAKYNSSGNLLWAIEIDNALNGRANTAYNELCVDSSNAIYAIGSFDDPIDLDPSSGSWVLSNNKSHSANFIAKYNSAGNLIWARKIESSRSVDLLDIEMSRNKELFVAGSFMDSLFIDSNLIFQDSWNVDGFLLGFDEQGNYGWNQQFSSSAIGRMETLAADPMGNLFSMGSFSDSLDADPSLGTDFHHTVSRDPFIVKLDSGGIWHYTKVFASFWRSQIFEFLIDQQANFHLCGSFYNSLDVDPGPNTLLMTSDESAAFYMKADSSFSSIYFDVYDAEDADNYCREMSLNPQDEAVITGVLVDSVDIDGSPDTVMLKAKGINSAWILNLANCNPVIQPSVSNLPRIYAECQIDTIPSPSASNGCGYQLKPIYPVSFPIDTQGVDTLLWTFDDGKGNRLIQSQIAEVKDTSKPVPQFAAPSISQRCDLAMPVAPLAYDSCSGTIRASTQNQFPISQNDTIVWVYEDDNGNQTIQKQSVIIVPFDTMVSQQALSLQANDSIGNYQWLDCNNSFLPVNGANQQSFTPFQNGSYALELHNNTCTFRSRCFTVTGVGLDEKGHGFLLYPNPNEGVFSLINYTFDEVQLLDLNGKTLWTSKLKTGKNIIDLGQISQGVYVIQCSSSSSNRLQRIVIR